MEGSPNHCVASGLVFFFSPQPLSPSSFAILGRHYRLESTTEATTFSAGRAATGAGVGRDGASRHYSGLNFPPLHSSRSAAAVVRVVPVSLGARVCASRACVRSRLRAGLWRPFGCHVNSATGREVSPHCGEAAALTRETPACYAPAMLLTEAHKKLNAIMQGRAVKSFGQRRRTVAEAMEQYDRIRRGSERAARSRAEAAARATPGPAGQ